MFVDGYGVDFSHASSHPDHGVFGRAVGGGILAAGVAVDGRDVDDAASLSTAIRAPCEISRGPTIVP